MLSYGGTSARSIAAHSSTWDAPYWLATGLPWPRSTSDSCCVTRACSEGAVSPSRLHACAMSSAQAGSKVSARSPAALQSLAARELSAGDLLQKQQSRSA